MKHVTELNDTVVSEYITMSIFIYNEGLQYPNATMRLFSVFLNTFLGTVEFSGMKE